LNRYWLLGLRGELLVTRTEVDSSPLTG
jgi:hypothetical protein